MNRRVIELVGPAGAGKTTLVGALDSSPRPPGGIGVAVGRLRLVAGLARGVPVLVAARLGAGGRWWTTAELRSIAYLIAWRPALARGVGQDGTAEAATALVILDHGPVFRLGTLAAQGPPMVRSRAFRRWWLHACRRWAELLDAVVSLDAPDPVLRARIEDRAVRHRVQGAGPREATVFLAGYRRAYEDLLDLLELQGTQVIRIDTSHQDPARSAALVRSRLGYDVAGPLR